ncbi:MAG TPA: hypothetical protein VFT53_02965 [Candidatus Saccharimonadales bacterium]|nr:hypothetical protein [Candidatus Saccharimonadales bacterium]
MKTQPSKERAESRVVNRYHKLYVPLIELIDALQDLEPGGTLVDNVKIGISEVDKKVHIEYTAHPITLTIKDGNRSFILRIAG